MTTHYDETLYAALFARLVPPSGKCSSLEGELLRAASRIAHDYTNNGFGNNWSGAYNFLDTYLGLRKTERELLRPYARGKVCRKATYDAADPILRATEDVVARVLTYIQESGDDLQPNPCDMLDLQEKDRW